MQTWVQMGRNPTTPTGRISPHIGSVVSVELTAKDAILPAFIALNGNPRAGAGFLPVTHAPFVLDAGAPLPNTSHAEGGLRFSTRAEILREAEKAGPQPSELGALPEEIANWKARAGNLMYNPRVERIFNLDPGERAAYGGTPFGDACLTARNLLRANLGTRYVQITYGSWDHHGNIYTQLPPMAGIFDRGVGQLLRDLRSDGSVDETLVVAMGEFGRTIGNLNGNRGRDHYGQQAVLMAGARIRGGRAIGGTDSNGRATLEPGWSKDRDIRAEDLEATIYSALGIDWTTLRKDNRFGRGFEYVPGGESGQYSPVHELWD
jgi:hypothetical protein